MMLPHCCTEQVPVSPGQRAHCVNGQTGVVLVLIDLDNTLIDRSAAYKTWATDFAAQQHGDSSAVDWLVAADKEGYETRPRLAEMIGARFGLPSEPLLAEMRAGLVERIVFDQAVGRALREATAAGCVPVVVTNGTVRQQERKLRHTGLDRLVAGWVISEGAGVRKPDRRIFEAAAAVAGASLDDGGWMIGDHAEYDIAGGAAAGLDTVWLHRGHSWPADLAPPTHIADDFPAAMRSAMPA
jgi:putative hydrolase of the HAD superfamily